MNATINILELASELADLEIKKHYSNDMKIYKYEDDSIYYTEEAQDLFDELYEEYYTLIEKCIS
jgi:hypothetical protein